MRESFFPFFIDRERVMRDFITIKDENIFKTMIIIEKIRRN